MNFDEYIEIMGKLFTISKVDESTYILHKDKKTIELTPSKMYSKDEILEKLDSMYPDIKEDPLFTNKESVNQKGSFGNVGEDDLHPAIGRKSRSRPHGSIFSPKDILNQEESDEGIDKTDIFPLKKKRDPDNDHFKKEGGDDDNPFLY